jgi:hypothetical protein
MLKRNMKKYRKLGKVTGKFRGINKGIFLHVLVAVFSHLAGQQHSLRTA